MATTSPQVAHAGHEHSAKRYYVIYFALLVLTATTYWTARHVHIGSWNVALALLIAVTKATLVVLFFMHLIDHKGTAAMVFAASVFFVLLLIGLVVTDNATRFPLANPPEATPQFKRNVLPPPPGEPSEGSDWRNTYAN
ncbi:MAG TPA: cytochrome C oxidase subunit IV family protein [Myxococcaceae bacterium]|nr:cytochrome C oxidase subunit IV family protein [Myxococcaceae bacterium]